jgi:uncharacterized membrane protein
MVSQQANMTILAGKRPPVGFGFKRFFTRGLAALLPTMITLSVMVWAWNFLWDTVGQYLILLLRNSWFVLAQDAYNSKKYYLFPFRPTAYIEGYWDPNNADTGMRTRIVGVVLAILLVYVVGIFLGNLIGRAAWRMAEQAVMRIPLVRAIYPAVKQVTDFMLSERTEQFAGSRVVAVQPHATGIWSIGLITGSNHWPTGEGGAAQNMVTVFVPSTPTAFSGYVLVVPRSTVVELPLSVEEAMRLLVSGGVIAPKSPMAADLDKPVAGIPPELLRRREPISATPSTTK